MTVTVAFDLNAEARRLLAESDNPDPKAVAEKLLEAIPFGLERDVLAQLLPEFLRGLAQKHRTYLSGGSNGGRKGRSIWTDLFDNPVSRGANDWTRLGELTAIECNQIAASYRARASELTVQADKFDALAAECRKRKVTMVKKLPRDVVEAIMVDSR